MSRDLCLFINHCFQQYPRWGVEIAALYKSLSEFQDNLETYLKSKRIQQKSRDIIANKIKTFDLKKIEQDCQEKNIQIVTLFDDTYPEQLKEIPDPPTVLYVLGDPKWLSYPGLAVVGTRDMTEYGKDVIQQIIPDLLKDYVIISGMARGADGEAHRTALQHGYPTVAVLGTGVDVPYPASNKRLYEDIQTNGCVISEFPLGTQADRTTFPKRNRIISGLSLGVLIIEAAESSGTLITAHQALEQNRDVFAVPGSIFSKQSLGVHKLIQQGAKCVWSAADIKEELQAFTQQEIPHIEAAAPKKSTPTLSITLTSKEQTIFDLLSTQISLDDLVSKSNAELPFILQCLSLFEMQGVLKRLPGNEFKVV